MQRNIIFVQASRFAHFKSRVNGKNGLKEQPFPRTMHYRISWSGEKQSIYMFFPRVLVYINHFVYILFLIGFQVI